MKSSIKIKQNYKSIEDFIYIYKYIYLLNLQIKKKGR